SNSLYELDAFFYDQILLYKLIICSILFHCSSSVRLLLSSVLANPHCGESNKRSAGKCSFASSTLCVIVLPSSSAGVFDVTSPSTTCVFSSLIFAKGSKPPERSSRSEEHMSELQSRFDLVCRLLL